MSVSLREFIIQHFDLEELRTLCFDLSVEYDDLRGEGRAAKVRELIGLMERLGRLNELIETVRERRSDAFEEAEVDLERELVLVEAEPEEPSPRVFRWRWERLQVGLLGLILVVLGVLIVMVRPWGKGTEPATATPPSVVEANTATPSKTPTPSPTPQTPTSTPSPSLTPSPSPTPTVPPADVLIAEFDARHASRTMEVARRLEADLQARLREHGLEDVKVKVVSRPVTNEDEAKQLASEAGGRVIIWGWYDDAGIQVRVFLAEEGQPGKEVPGTRELPLELGGVATAELSFVVRDVLPDNVSFLSLFVIGHLHYLANEYQAGHDAFDAATDSMPEKVELENEAILHFFRARELEAAGIDEMKCKNETVKVCPPVLKVAGEILTEIVCEYAKAIELDPGFAEAYNNLGIIFARYAEPMTPADWFLSDEARSCLTDANLESGWTPGAFFDHALQLQPGWTIAEYNKLGFHWEFLDTLPLFWESPAEAIAWLKAELEAVVQRDPSILGAYIILGNIALEEQDFEAASRWFSSALKLASPSESAKLHFNLGQAYLRDGQEEQAEAEFEAAVAADAKNAEAHLALANLALRRGQRDAALKHLDALLPWEGELGTYVYPISPGTMAMILRSRLYLEGGELDQAIETLDQLVSRVTSYTPLEHYLLGLLYALKDVAEGAEEQWSAIKVWGVPESDSNASSALAWYDIDQLCDIMVHDEISDWDPVSNSCLPTDLQDRISTVYDLFQDRLPYRFNYRKVWYGGAACPYVFIYDSVHQTWQWDTTILYDLTGQENEALQRRRLTRFDGRLLIREVEPETSYIDQLYVLVAGDDGEEQVLPAPLTMLQEADGHYLVLSQGDELLLIFDGYQSMQDAGEAWVVAKGYYVPLWDRPQD